MNQHVCAMTLPLLQSLTLAILLNGGEVTSGGLHRRSTASGEREASDHAHHIWIVPAQRMEPLYSAVLRAYQQYRRLVRAVASSRDILISKKSDSALMGYLKLMPE